MVGLCRVGRGSQPAVTQAILWRAARNEGRWVVVRASQACTANVRLLDCRMQEVNGGPRRR